MKREDQIISGRNDTDAPPKQRSDRPCLHCSYVGKKKYKLCVACLALWFKDNGYDAAGNKVEQ